MRVELRGGVPFGSLVELKGTCLESGPPGRVWRAVMRSRRLSCAFWQNILDMAKARGLYVPCRTIQSLSTLSCATLLHVMWRILIGKPGRVNAFSAIGVLPQCRFGMSRRPAMDRQCWACVQECHPSSSAKRYTDCIVERAVRGLRRAGRGVPASHVRIRRRPGSFASWRPAPSIHRTREGSLRWTTSR